MEEETLESSGLPIEVWHENDKQSWLERDNIQKATNKTLFFQGLEVFLGRSERCHQLLTIMRKIIVVAHFYLAPIHLCFYVQESRDALYI